MFSKFFIAMNFYFLHFRREEFNENSDFELKLDSPNDKRCVTVVRYEVR